MSADAAGFYDDLADDYHLIFVDWDRTIAYQAGVLVPLLRRLGVPDGGRVLDASCGIGTQALGLAAAGYAVTGTDLSPGAIERARAEAAARGLDAATPIIVVRDASLAGCQELPLRLGELGRLDLAGPAPTLILLGEVYEERVRRAELASVARRADARMRRRARA